MDKAHVYEIRIEDHLTEHRSDRFEGLAIYDESNGETVLRGSFADQADLFGTLTKIYSLNLTLISVKRLSL